MERFGRFYLDKEKDMIVDLYMEDRTLFYTLRTPNHSTGNLIRNFAKLCGLPLEKDENGLLIIRDTIPSYYDINGRMVYVFRLANTKVANIYPDGTIEIKAMIPSISKTLMSQTKHYAGEAWNTIVKTYIRTDCKFRTDLHTHMNANLSPDLLIALGIFHQIRYPLYYIRKLSLRLTRAQMKAIVTQRARVAKSFQDSSLTGKYLTRKIDDNTFINFASLILHNLKDSEYNIARIRASLAVLKDGQAVFSNLEKVYLYRYVFTKGISMPRRISLDHYEDIPDPDIVRAIHQMMEDRNNPVYAENTLFRDKLLWIARSCRVNQIDYVEISDTTLVKPSEAPHMLEEVHAVMPEIYRETGVSIRFLAAFRRIPLTIVKDQVTAADYLRANLTSIQAVASDPYVMGSDIVGEEINDIRELQPLIKELTRIAETEPSFVIRIHAGENDSLRDNVANAIACVRNSLKEGQAMPRVRIGHGLYTANLSSAKGKRLLQEIRENRVIVEFQISSNVRLNNLSSLKHHPLRRYLAAGIMCVQGTDGGALYGTDSVDEQLALERLLNLTQDDFMKMRRAEDQIIDASLAAFEDKLQRFEKNCGTGPVSEFYRKRMEKTDDLPGPLLSPAVRYASETELKKQIEPLPKDGYPIIIAGGSFNSDTHSTKVRQNCLDLLDQMLEQLDPEKVFFVIGDRISGYEKALVEKCEGRWRIFAIVPTHISGYERNKLTESRVRIRVSIDPTGMGLYKSFAYEVFKRRESAVILFDGNSAAANLMQEAKNGKYRAKIFASDQSRMLKMKAASLRGYVTMFHSPEQVLSAFDPDLFLKK